LTICSDSVRIANKEERMTRITILEVRTSSSSFFSYFMLMWVI